TRGYWMFGHSPSLTSESLWQTPHACTLIRTDPGPGSGIGRWTISKGPFGRDNCATRMVAIFPVPFATEPLPAGPASRHPTPLTVQGRLQKEPDGWFGRFCTENPVSSFGIIAVPARPLLVQGNKDGPSILPGPGRHKRGCSARVGGSGRR